MSVSDDSPTEVRFLLDVERHSYNDDVSIIARPVHFTDGEIRNINSGRYDMEPLADLCISALADKSETFGDSYGWSREYRNVFSVDTVRATAMAKQLRALDKGMEKLEREFGYAENFPSYLARVASVLRIRSFGWKVSDGGHGMYDSNGYRWSDAAAMTDWVRRQLTDFRKVAV